MGYCYELLWWIIHNVLIYTRDGAPTLFYLQIIDWGRDMPMRWIGGGGYDDVVDVIGRYEW